jgi:uncharacterized membrane protein
MSLLKKYRGPLDERCRAAAETGLGDFLFVAVAGRLLVCRVVFVRPVTVFFGVPLDAAGDFDDAGVPAALPREVLGRVFFVAVVSVSAFFAVLDARFFVAFFVVLFLPVAVFFVPILAVSPLFLRGAMDSFLSMVYGRIRTQ